MPYYHDLVTEKSWEELKALRSQADFVLLGGWAVYLYTKRLKSKDIDIMVNFDQLSILEKRYHFFKNERLRKYEAVKGEVQIDIYLPHFSRIGIPVEELVNHKKSVDGFIVLDIDYLFALKIYTLSQRGHSAKGQKDFLDLLSLAISGKCLYKKIAGITADYNLREQMSFFENFLSYHTEIKELDLNAHGYSKLKKMLVTNLFKHP